MGLALFSLVLDEALRARRAVLPEGELLAYLDDTTLVGPPAAVEVAFAAMARELEAVGLAVQPSKCQVFGTCPLALAEAAALPHLRRFPQTTEGITVVGCPVGTPEYVLAFGEEALQALTADAHHLGSLGDAQAAFCLLRECLASRAAFLTRVVSPSAPWWAALEALDTRLWRVVQQILGHEEQQDGVGELDATLWEAAREQAFLPLSEGGLGLRSSRRVAPLSYLCAWAQCLAPLAERFPHLFPTAVGDVAAVTGGGAEEQAAGGSALEGDAALPVEGAREPLGGAAPAGGRLDGGPAAGEPLPPEGGEARAEPVVAPEQDPEPEPSGGEGASGGGRR